MTRIPAGIRIREIVASDTTAIVSLNQSVVSVTSPMDMVKLGQLLDVSNIKFVATVNDECVAFMIAIADGRDFENENYRWFSGQLEDFLYVDRVVVSDAHRGQRIGSLLYSHLFGAAQHNGYRHVAAEIDVQPPNIPSLRFHEKMGFIEIGRRDLASGKQVSMQAFRVDELV